MQRLAEIEVHVFWKTPFGTTVGKEFSIVYSSLESVSNMPTCIRPPWNGEQPLRSRGRFPNRAGLSDACTHYDSVSDLISRSV